MPEAHAGELAELVSRENGKPVAEARLHDVGFLVGIVRYFGSLADNLPSESYDKGSIYTSTVLEARGVVGEIIPFNWPAIHAGGKIAPALAVGNTSCSSRENRPALARRSRSPGISWR